MIQAFVDRFMANEQQIRSKFAEHHPGEYKDIVRLVIENVADENAYYDAPDPKRIHEIDNGCYQGTLIYVIGSNGYQPFNYWYVKVEYGSCSGCDTLESIRGYEDDPPTQQQADDYWTLALHIVQELCAMQDEH